MITTGLARNELATNGSAASTSTTLRACLDEAKEALLAGAINHAIDLCFHVSSSFPKCIEAHCLLGEAYREKGLTVDAENAFRRVLSADPENLIARWALGILQEDRGNPEAALWELWRAFDLSPGHGELRSELTRLSQHDVFLTRAALGRIYARGELYDMAVAEFRAILEAEPDRLDLLVALAEALWRDRRYGEARAVCVQALADSPDCLKANIILGHTLSLAGEKAKAQRFLDRAELLDPENVVAAQLLDGTDVEALLHKKEVALPPFQAIEDKWDHDAVETETGSGDAAEPALESGDAGETAIESDDVGETECEDSEKPISRSIEPWMERETKVLPIGDVAEVEDVADEEQAVPDEVETVIWAVSTPIDFVDQVEQVPTISASLAVGSLAVGNEVETISTATTPDSLEPEFAGGPISDEQETAAESFAAGNEDLSESEMPLAPLDADVPGAVVVQEAQQEVATADQAEESAAKADKERTETRLQQVKENPQDFQAHLALAQAYHRAGQIDQAVQEFELVARSAPEFADRVIEGLKAILKSNPDHIVAHRILGDAFMAIGRYQQAIEYYNRCVNLQRFGGAS